MTHPAVASAHSLMESRRFTEAAQALRSHLAQNPDDLDAQGLLMQVQEKLMLEMQVQQRLKKARGALLEGDPAGARKIAEEILGSDPGHPEAQEILASAGDAAAAPMVGGGDFIIGGEPVMDAPMMVADGGDFLIAAEPPPLMGADEMMSTASIAMADAPPPPAVATGGGNPALSAAENGKIKDFLNKGRIFLAADNQQDAIDILTRVFIIDENNAEAQQLIDQARATLDSVGAALDNEVNDAIGHFNAGNFAAAKEAFGEVLKKSPNHAEALNYLGQIAQSESAAPQQAGGMGVETDGGFDVDLGADATPAAAPQAPTMAAPPPPVPEGGGRGAIPAASFHARPAAAAPAPRPSAGVPGWAKGAAALFVLGGGAALYLLVFRKTAPPPVPPPVVVAPVIKPKVVEAPVASAPAAAPVDPHLLELQALIAGKDVNAMLKQAQKEYDLLAYANVRLLLDAVQDSNPNDGVMLKLRHTAEEQETLEKGYVEAYNGARDQLKVNDFPEALRRSWGLRHPESQLVLAQRLGIREKVMAVWGVACYNTALQMMRNSNLSEAEGLLDDVHEVDPKNEKANLLRDEAKKYRGVAPDKTFYQYVNGLPFLPPPPA